ncbi:oligosaccharide MFS transporter [Orbaceae bacterium ESL0721]|nr:oligosaccharide MFS transporter [Orbaceae bacterium ESL0721]
MKNSSNNNSCNGNSSNNSNKNYCAISSLFFFFFFTWSSSSSLLSIWLSQTIGLIPSQTGVIFSILSISALCTQVCYGFMQDKLGIKKNLLWIIGALLILSGPNYLLFGYLLRENLYVGSIFGGIFIALTFNGAIGLLEAYSDRTSRLSDFEFGKARMWGSIGWAIAIFFSGLLFNINPNINFAIASISGLLFCLLLTQLDLKKMKSSQYLQQNRVTLVDALSLLKQSHFWKLILFVVGTCIYGVYDQQFPIYYSSQFATVQQGNEMFGYLNSFQVFLEAGGLFIAPWFVNRIGAKNGLIFAGTIMAIRMVGSGLVDGPILISVMKLCHSLELPVLLISIFKYNSINFDKRLSATVYLVGFACTSSVIGTFLSPLAGLCYERFGFANSYIMMGCAVFIITALSSILLSSNQNDLNSEQENALEEESPSELTPQEEF